jgi:aspartyl-tRNA(Asn)/glutamyl-tRNA(Gln) amidotransferase subunit C
MITKKEVEEIAQLARLGLSEAEIERMTRELGAILGYIEKLRGLDTEGVEPTTHAVPMDCPLREDGVGGQLPTEDALREAPKRDGDLFGVPKIIEVGE